MGFVSRIAATREQEAGGSIEEMVTRRIKEDGDEHGMLIYGYKFRYVMGQDF